MVSGGGARAKVELMGMVLRNDEVEASEGLCLRSRTDQIKT